MSAMSEQSIEMPEHNADRGPQSWEFKHSSEISELLTALSLAQGAIENAVKDSDNPYHKSHYSDLASVRNAIRKPLMENGLSVIQGTEISCDGEMILVTMLGHKSGQWIKCFYKIMPGQSRSGGFMLSNDPQSIGSAITYGRRYMLMAMTGVAPDDDDGEKAMGRDKPPTKSKQLAQKAQQAMNPKQAKKSFPEDVAFIKNKITERKGAKYFSELLGAMGYESLGQVPPDAQDKIKKELLRALNEMLAEK